MPGADSISKFFFHPKYFRIGVGHQLMRYSTKTTPKYGMLLYDVLSENYGYELLLFFELKWFFSNLCLGFYEQVMLNWRVGNKTILP